MGNQQLTATAKTAPLTLSEKDDALLRLRHPVAQAWALDQIIQLAVSEGELDQDQLENLCLLTRRLHDDLEKLAAFIDDLGIVPTVAKAGGPS